MKMNRFKVGILVVLFFSFIMICDNSVCAAEADLCTVNVEGKIYYNNAQKILELVNKERKRVGASTLKLDKDLTKSAMKRAAECAVDFSHTRPNNKSCFSINERINGENIAVGSSTSASTFDLWVNSSGHYANIINSDYKSMGVGCFLHNGTYYWVQLFSIESAISVETTDSVKTEKYSVSLIEGNYKIEFNINKGSDKYTLKAGKKLELVPGRINPGWNIVYCEFAADSFNWKSSNTAIATVDSKGVVTAKSNGKVTIKATPKNGDGSITVEVTCTGGSASESGKNESVTVKKVKKLTVKNIKKKSIKLSWKSVKKADGYQIKYSTNKKYKTYKKKSTKKTKYTLKKLKKGKTYYIKVRAYVVVNGEKKYGKWSAKKKCKIKK